MINLTKETPFEKNKISNSYILKNKKNPDEIRIIKQFLKKGDYNKEIEIFKLLKDKNDILPMQYEVDSNKLTILTDYFPNKLDYIINKIYINNNNKLDINNKNQDFSNVNFDNIIVNLIKILNIYHSLDITHNNFRDNNIYITSLSNPIIANYNKSLKRKKVDNLDKKISDLNNLKIMILQIIFKLPYDEVKKIKKYNELISLFSKKYNKDITLIKNIFLRNTYNIFEIYDFFSTLLRINKNNKKNKNDNKILNDFFKEVKFNNQLECSSKKYKEPYFIKKEELIKTINKFKDIKNLLPTDLNSLKKEDICLELFKLEKNTEMPFKEVIEEYKNIDEISNILLDFEKGKPVNFNCWAEINAYIYLHILNKHKKICCVSNIITDWSNPDDIILIKNKNAFEKSNIIENSRNHSINFALTPNLIKKQRVKKILLTKYESCCKNNKLLCVPFLILNGKHANMLIFNHKLKQLERYEPHGEKTLIDTNLEEEIDEILNDLVIFFKRNGKTKFTTNFKFSPSNDTCPVIPKNIRETYISKVGLQVFDGTAKQKKQTSKILQKTFQDPNGFCCMWSYLYMDYRLYNPTIESNELGTRLLQKFKEDPYVLLRKYIRGYTQGILNDLVKHVKKKENLFTLMQHHQEINKGTFKFNEYKDLLYTLKLYLLKLYGELI